MISRSKKKYLLILIILVIYSCELSNDSDSQNVYGNLFSMEVHNSSNRLCVTWEEKLRDDDYISNFHSLITEVRVKENNSMNWRDEYSFPFMDGYGYVEDIELDKLYTVETRVNYGDDNYSEWGNSIDITLNDIVPPEPVSNLSVNTIEGGLEIQWDNPETDLSHVKIEYYITDWNTLEENYTSDSYIHSGLVTTDFYKYRVTTYDSAGNEGPVTVSDKAFTYNMISISPGSYTRDNGKEVYITKGFYIAETEVTHALFYKVFGGITSNDWTVSENSFWSYAGSSFYEAIEFCNNLSRLQGLEECYTPQGNSWVCDFTKNGYRLPTEAEWEYAYKAGTSTKYFWGNETDIEIVSLYAKYKENNNPDDENNGLIKQYLPNPWGIYDMAGGDWEWCWDTYDEVYYTNMDNSIDPRGPSFEGNKVKKGGCQINVVESLAYSCRYPKTRGHAGTGFRVVRTNN